MANQKTLPKVVVLTGAGISRESGLETFRDAGGVWQKVRLEDVCTPEALQRDPNTVNAFYNARRAQLPTVEPNPAHAALAQLESTLGEHFLLVTQNVDDLHQRAGSKRIIPMHGELLKAECQRCGDIHHWDGDILPDSPCPTCKRTGSLRPRIVFFGEMPLEMDRIYQAVLECDLFAAIGTSGNVYPAAGLVEMAKQGAADTVELNLEPSANADSFTTAHYGPATEVVPAWVEQLLASLKHE